MCERGDGNTEPSKGLKHGQPSLDALIESARGYVMSPEEKEEQRQNFARANDAIDSAPDSRRTIALDETPSLDARIEHVRGQIEPPLPGSET